MRVALKLMNEETCPRSIHAKVSAKVSIAHGGAAAQRRRRHGCAVGRRCMACGHGMLWWKGVRVASRHEGRVPLGQSQGPGGGARRPHRACLSPSGRRTPG